MGKYRIKKVTQRNGRECYYAEKRFWFFFWKDLNNYWSYSQKELAQQAIDDDIKWDKLHESSKIEKTEYFYNK